MLAAGCFLANCSWLVTRVCWLFAVLAACWLLAGCLMVISYCRVALPTKVCFLSTAFWLASCLLAIDCESQACCCWLLDVLGISHCRRAFASARGRYAVACAGYLPADWLLATCLLAACWLLDGWLFRIAFASRKQACSMEQA